MRWQIEVTSFTDGGAKTDFRLGVVPEEATLEEWRNLLLQLLESFEEPPKALTLPPS